MKLGDKTYDALVDKLRGNVSSVKMTPEECQAEIHAIQAGARSIFESPFAEGCTIHGTHTLPDGTTIEVGPQVIHASQGYVTKSGRVYKNKPGRRPKS